MTDIILEVLRALILAVLLFWLWKQGKNSFSQITAGWNFILWGFGLLLFGSILDITDNFESLNWLVIIGDTEVESFLEKFVGSLGGFLMLAIGLTIWIPKIQSLSSEIEYRKQVEEELQEQQEHLEELVEEKTTDLMHAKEVAEQANEAKSMFLANMSHEFRTPLHAILGFGQLLEYDQDLPDEDKANVQEIIRAGQHLLELINEVLDLAKIESGQIALSIEPVELMPVIDNCLNQVATLADKQNIQISHSGLTEVVVRADHTRLKQALLNLLSNAIKYNHKGGTVKVDVQIHEEDRIRILVTDSGKGISSEQLSELFQPFHRLDQEHSTIEGTGIGLTITRRVVELMDGKVDVKSSPGVGSTFWIELPLESIAKSDQVNIAPQAQTVEQEIASQGSEQYTVLYIEDNPANIRLIEKFLAKRKHIKLLTAHTSELGIELAMTNQPDLILQDINMPGLNGYQVLTILKSKERLNNIPVIAITANAMPRDIKRGLAAGFSDYLTKPLDMIHFYNVIDKTLGIEDKTDTDI